MLRQAFLAATCLAIMPVLESASAQVLPTDTSTKHSDIVVTGQRLGDLQQALKECIAKNCPPDQDIAATLAVAENQFVGGDYHAARSTLGRSIDRNKRFAKQYPVAVSDLLRANYRVAEHLGDGESYRIGTFDMVSALKAGLPDDDARVLAAEVEVGDMYARFSRYDEAVDRYASIEKRAGADGLWYVQGMARLRIVSLYAQLAEKAPYPFRDEARRAADVLEKSHDSHMAAFAQAARIVVARADAKNGDTAAVDRLIADLRSTEDGTTPVLLYQPPIKFVDRQDLDLASGSTTMRLARENYDNAWVDIGFWVTPDGHVSDIDVLRSGTGKDTPNWTKPILTAISGRRYAPLKLNSAEPGVMRVERYTLTARQTFVTGSRLQAREMQPQIEMLDLSVAPKT